MYFSLTMTCYKVETCCINKIHKRLFVSTVIHVTTKQGGGAWGSVVVKALRH